MYPYLTVGDFLEDVLIRVPNINTSDDAFWGKYIKDSTYTLKFKSQANNITKLTVTRNPQKDSNTVYKSFVSVPELNNCKFTNEIRIYADSADNTSLPEKKVIFDNIEEDFDKDNKIYETFMYKGKIVAKIHAKSWIYKVSDAYDVL